jgi:gas vesicle protein
MNDNNSKILAGILIGAVAGVVTGLLLAPSSGTETRKKITDKAKELGKDVNEQLDKTFSKITNLADSKLAQFKKDTPVENN